MRRVAAVLVVCVALLVLAGCTPAQPAAPPATPPSESTPSVGASTTAPVVKQIAVPDVVGKMSDKAVAALESAGLQAVEKSIYGPTDEDAGEPGVVYRQTPKAGTLVAPGSKVEVRYWYETQ